MATSRKDIKQVVTTEFTQEGVEQFQRELDRIGRALDALPGKTKTSNPAIQSLATELKKVTTLFNQNKLTDGEWLASMSQIKNMIGTIKTMTSGLKLFEEQALKAATEELRKQVDLAKELAEVGKQARQESALQTDMRAKHQKKVQDEENIRVEESKKSADKIARQESSLQADMRARHKQRVEGEAADKVEADRKAEEKIAKNRDRNRTRSAPRIIQPWELDSVPNAKAFNELGNGSYKGQNSYNFRTPQQMRDNSSQIRQWMEEQEADRIEINRLKGLRTKFENEQAEKAAKQAEIDSRPSRQQRALEARKELATGEGAASLMMIQAALIANATLLNGAINTIKQTIDFSVQLEASFRNVEAVIGTTKTEMIGLETTIKQVSTTTKFSALEVSEAALTLGQAGLSAKQISEAIMPVVTLANAAGSSIANAVDLVTSVIGVFDKNSGDVADVANKITQAANGSKVSVEKLALGFQYAGNTAAQLGISFEEVTAAMAAMSNAGIKSGSTMGTGLRQFLTEVQKPSEAFLETLRRVGLSISDLDFRSKGFIGVIRTLKESGFVASDAINSFDVRSAAAFNALLARPDDLQAQYDSLRGSTAATRANEIQMDSLASQASRLTNILGVLASTGFDPVIKAATGLFRVLGDGLSKVTEFEGTLKVLGTVLAGLAAGVAFSWIGPLIAGLVNLLGLLPLLTTGFAAFGTAALAAVPPAALVAAGVMALVGAYSAFQYVTGETARTLDEAKAAFDKSKGAATEKEEAIKSLDNRLEMLRAREGSVIETSDEFKSLVEDSKQAMEKWGFSIDTTGISMEGLQSKIAGVRDELNKMKLIDMNQAASQAFNVARLEADKHQKTLADLKEASGGNSIFSSAESVMGKGSAFYNSLATRGVSGQSDMQKMALEVLQAAQSGKDVSTMGGPTIERALSNFLSSAEGKKLSMADRRVLNENAQAIGAVGTQGSVTRQAQALAKSSLDDYEKGENIRRMYDNLAKSGVDLRKEFSVPNLMTQAKSSLPEGDQKDAAKISEAARLLMNEKLATIQTAMDKGLAMATTEAEKDHIKTAGKAAQEIAKDFYMKSTPGAQAQAAREKKVVGGADEAELSRITNSFKKGVGSKADQDRGIELITKLNTAERVKANLTQTDPEEIAANNAEFDRKKAEQIEKFMTDIRAKARSAATKALNDEEKSVSALIEAQMRLAKSAKSRANKNMSLDDISDLMDKGLEHIAEAKKLEVESNVRKYGKTGTIAENYAAATEEKYKAAADTLIGSFSSLIENATEATFGISRKIKEIDAHIKRIVNESEARIYEGDAGLRANNRDQARNNGSVSGRTRTEIDSFYTSREREQLDYNSAVRNIAEKTRERSETEKQRSILNDALLKANLSRADTTSRITGLLGGRNPEDLSTDDRAKYQVLITSLNALNSEITAGEGKVEGYTSKINALRDSVEDWENKKIGLTPGEQAPETWDTLEASMLRVLDVFDKISSEANVFKTLEDGMLGVSKSISGEMANAFAGVVTGTMSVSDAFRSMAGNIIKSMIQVLAQALAMQAVKGILGIFLPTGLGVASAPAGGVNGWAGTDIAGITMPTAASGGEVIGGTPGKDSVPVLTMPGEFILKKPAVDALGLDFVSRLNNMSADMVSNASASTAPAQPKAGQNQKGSTMNIWVVTPDQMGGTSSDDIVATVSDNIVRGGSIKQLIKTVALGA